MASSIFSHSVNLPRRRNTLNGLGAAGTSGSRRRLPEDFSCALYS
jgi:hypothetical protein